MDYVDRATMDPLVRPRPNAAVNRAQSARRGRDPTVTERTVDGKRWVLIKRTDDVEQDEE
jgi:hypothetical protein